MFTVGGAQFTVGGAVFTVGGAEEKNYPFFSGGGSTTPTPDVMSPKKLK